MERKTNATKSNFVEKNRLSARAQKIKRNDFDVACVTGLIRAARKPASVPSLPNFIKRQTPSKVLQKLKRNRLDVGGVTPRHPIRPEESSAEKSDRATWPSCPCHCMESNDLDDLVE